MRGLGVIWRARRAQLFGRQHAWLTFDTPMSLCGLVKFMPVLWVVVPHTGFNPQNQCRRCVLAAKTILAHEDVEEDFL